MWSKQELEQYKQIILTETGRELSDEEAQVSATRIYNLVKLFTDEYEYEDTTSNTSSF